MSPKSLETKAPSQRGDGNARRSPATRRLIAGLQDTVAAAHSLLEAGDRAHAGVATDALDLLLDEIAPDPDQPRRHFDDADLRSLADDITRRGVLQPILVRPPAQTGDPYRLVAGERRWRAARLAGRVRIPVRVRDLSDEDVQAAQLAENVLRAGLTDIEKGRALRRLYEIRKAQNHKITWEDVGDEVGLGRARIHDLFNLAALPPAVAALIESGRLTGSHGILLQRAQDALGADEVQALAEQAARPEGKRAGGCALTVARLRELIQDRAGREQPAAHRPHASGGADIQPLKPFVKRTIEAVTSGKLTPEERATLLAALNSYPDSQPAEPKL